MVSLLPVLFGVIISSPFILFCFNGYAKKSIRGIRLYRRLRNTESKSATPLSVGETVAIEGTVSVDEEAFAADEVVEAADSPVAMYIWRARRVGSGTYTYDVSKRELKNVRTPFESGIESGEFTVDTGHRHVRIDPRWLRTARDAPRLSEVTAEDIGATNTTNSSLWDSLYVQFASDATEVPLERIQTGADILPDLQQRGWDVQSKAAQTGDTLTVFGEVTPSRGSPVIRGTDGTPLLISDRSIDSLRNDLLFRGTYYGCIAFGALLAGLMILLYGFSIE